MGSSQSSRKITVPNESAHIIKVSDAVIDRLKNVEGTAPKPVANSVTTSSNISNVTSAFSSQSFPETLTSLRVLQEKEKQLKENDLYWANRVKSLESAQSNTSRLMEQEFSKTVASIEDTLPKMSAKLSEAPCADKKAKVLECYRMNPKQILLCAKEISEFTDCVDLKRLTTA